MGETPAFDEAAALRAHAERVAQLCRPGAVARHLSQAPDGCLPQRIETHLSTLLLYPERVLKLKKPLCRPFVDFSTTALREAACRHELRLNRRAAPQLYLDVLPVCHTPDGLRLGAATVPDGAVLHGAVPDGAVLDWAVLMRRFDARQGFDHLARAGQLQPAQVDALAAEVARFHALLAPAPAGFGSAERTRHWPRDNLRELAALLPRQGAGAAARLARLAQLADWTEARGAALAALIEQRRAGGRVRECHGDLHLGNIVWAGGAPLLFDALEFNPALRHIDTLGDLAFCFMDLHAHGLPRLAWRFVSAALEAADDHAALPLLGWWAAYRAAVRAKVALLAGDEPGGPGGPAGQPALARADALLALALRLGPQQAAAPRLVLMMGLSGSGKSRVAAALAEGLGGVRLRSDVERKRLFGLAADARGGAALGLYTPEANRRTHARLHALAEGALRAGVPVVLDAASLRRSERDAVRALAARLGLPFTLVLCEAPEALLRERLAQRAARGDDASDAGPELLHWQQGLAEWPDAAEAAEAAARPDTAVAAAGAAGAPDARLADVPGGAAGRADIRRLDTAAAQGQAWPQQVEAWLADWWVARAGPAGRPAGSPPPA
ncbi:bifunctional aminoglycoside phosphotransferase/ATP-binding protein [Aquabacterium sp. OR-4]|uniref:bifunctional aminoglycoside phosphotransferase/ATP-binding protein n=1 Tax=Aquabacterium sp. OR-4 TaxID=2978127 RepID=UPI0028C6110B|nr:AAA family ATPase [Aquabacterium sp. OR-4]MDT7837738.1 AAA family ATPase [Aquabacterium sp. OR-4]